MNMRSLSLLVAASVVHLAISAQAQAKPPHHNQSISESDVISGKAKPDPQSGYILIDGSRAVTGIFMRIPDAVTRAAWEQDRKLALTKALSRYAVDVSDWQATVDLNKMRGYKGVYPSKPAEPTIDTVSVTPLETRDLATFGPQFRYTKGAHVTFLTAVKPGTYYWTGPWGGPCMCMGTVEFEVKAGVVTNLGNMLWALPRQEGNMTVARLAAQQKAELRAEAGKKPQPDPSAPPPLDITLPDSLKAWPVVTAELHAHGKFNNYAAVVVSRLDPIPGVLAYSRDTVIDERTGQALANPKLVSSQKPKI